MFKKHLLFIAVAVTLFAACNKPKVTDSGLTYEFRREGTGVEVDSGMVVMLNFTQYLMKDTAVKNKRESSEPMAVPVAPADGDLIMEGLLMAKEGDSVMLSFPATKLVPEGQPLPPGLDPDMTMRMEIGIIKVYTKEAYAEEKRKEAEAIAANEEKAILEYAAANNLTTVKTPSGLHYAIITEGKGKKAQPGEMIEVHYDGKLLDGTQFDASRKRNETFKFPVGTGSVIPGWDEGFLLLNEGSTAVLLIPSYLAYGSRNMGVIKPNSILRFDVEYIKNLGNIKPE